MAGPTLGASTPGCGRTQGGASYACAPLVGCGVSSLGQLGDLPSRGAPNRPWGHIKARVLPHIKTHTFGVSHLISHLYSLA